ENGRLDPKVGARPDRDGAIASVARNRGERQRERALREKDCPGTTRLLGIARIVRDRAVLDPHGSSLDPNRTHAKDSAGMVVMDPTAGDHGDASADDDSDARNPRYLAVHQREIRAHGIFEPATRKSDPLDAESRLRGEHLDA